MTTALRDQVGPVHDLRSLRRAADLLARHLGLPRQPRIVVGYAPWKGPGTAMIDCVAARHGHFTIARWAVRGKYRRPWPALEHALVSAIAFWLELERGDPVFSAKAQSEALIAWYGEEVGAPLAAAEARHARKAKGCLIALGALLGAYLVLWAVGVLP